MLIASIVISFILSVFSTTVMSYISMATPIGPWIAPTLVLLALLLSKILRSSLSNGTFALVISAGSIGGIVATACGFYFPTLFFLDQSLFNAWMARPFFFITTLASLSFIAGWFGLIMANIFEHSLIIEQQLSFPIGQLVYKMITAQHQIKKMYELVIGFVLTGVFCILQNGTRFFHALLPKMITILPSATLGIFTTPHIWLQLDIMPMVWAIGFVTGHVVVLPLGVGALAKTFLVDPINRLFFTKLSNIEFVLAFCSGMVMMSVVLGIITTPKYLWKLIRKTMTHIPNLKSDGMKHLDHKLLFEIGVVGLLVYVFLCTFNFSYLTQLYLVVFTAICTYQIAVIAGKIGLALMGRFATFVMVPAMLLFHVDNVQIVIIASFVGIAGGVATDVLFSRKLAHLANISSATMKWYQLFGLLVSSVTVGIVFWFLVNHFGLGSSKLFAYRAQSRQLLIQVQQFDYIVLFLGAIFGYILKYVKLNPMLVLGGLLMPINITFGLIVGGLFALIPQEREDWYPFWSGVFASNSICMFIRAML